MDCRLIIGLVLFFPFVAFTAAIPLSPQDVVDRVLKNGYDAKAIEFQARKSVANLYKARGVYDWGVAGSLSYEINKNESLSGISNQEDRTTYWTGAFTKKTSTGSLFSLGYSRTFQQSKLSGFSSSLRPSDQVQDQFDFGIRQDLIGNFFGLLDRTRIEVAEQAVEQSRMARLESLESLVLQAVQVYWQCYIAKETLKESLQAREKYSFLLKTLENKNRLGLADTSDVFKARAEYQNQERNVKVASHQYLVALDELFLLMRENSSSDSGNEVEFVVSDGIPPVPNLVSKELESFRDIQASVMTLQNAELERKAAKLATLPELAIFGKSSFNGVEQKATDAFSDMTSASHPRYTVGLELKLRIDSDLVRGEKELREIQYAEASNALDKLRAQKQEELLRAYRDVQSKYTIAGSAIEAYKNWASAVKEQERKFRMGRISTTEMIQDYNSFFRSQAQKSSAIGSYHVALHFLDATRDELVLPEKAGTLEALQ